MPKNQNKLYIKISTAVILAIIVAIFAYTQEKTDKNINQKAISPLEQKKAIEIQAVNSGTEKKAEQKIEIESKKNTEEDTEENTKSATILAGNTTVQLQFAPGAIFYDALTQAKIKKQIEFNGKNYPGLGFFVTDIGTLHSGGGKYLLYYINGQEATVGVSAYTLKDGDIIEWKLE